MQGTYTQWCAGKLALWGEKKETCLFFFFCQFPHCKIFPLWLSTSILSLSPEVGRDAHKPAPGHNCRAWKVRIRMLALVYMHVCITKCMHALAFHGYALQYVCIHNETIQPEQIILSGQSCHYLLHRHHQQQLLSIYNVSSPAFNVLYALGYNTLLGRRIITANLTILLLPNWSLF